MREVFSDTLVEQTLQNDRAILMTGDHGYALFDKLRKVNPKRYLNAGIAEQNMVGVAAGMAKAGFIPIVYGLSSFIPVRVLEQIKLDVCFENLKVIFIGDGAGVVYSKLGVSHQSFEDIAVLRSIPNIQILSPCDRYEMKFALDEAFKSSGPSYIRMGKSDIGNVHEKPTFTAPGVHEIAKGSNKAPIIFATGSMVNTAASLVASTFKDFGLYSISRLKPLKPEDIVPLIQDTDVLITMEEHSIYGGLGGVISELVSAYQPKRILRIGINDQFTKKCGTYEFVMREHGLDLNGVKSKILALLEELK